MVEILEDGQTEVNWTASGPLWMPFQRDGKFRQFECVFLKGHSVLGRLTVEVTKAWLGK